MINNVLEGLKGFIREYGKGIGLAISAIVVLIVLAYSMQIFTLSFYTPLQLYNNSETTISSVYVFHVTKKLRLILNQYSREI